MISPQWISWLSSESTETEKFLNGTTFPCLFLLTYQAHPSMSLLNPNLLLPSFLTTEAKCFQAMLQLLTFFIPYSFKNTYCVHSVF